MVAKELEAGKRWVERRFEKISQQLGTHVRTLAKEDRWRPAAEAMGEDTHCMTFYIEFEGHVRPGDLALRGADLEDAGAGEEFSQDKLERQIRFVLGSFRQ